MSEAAEAAERHAHWAVMYNSEGHISMTTSDGKPVPEGTTIYNTWTCVATDLSEEDARCYVRMNWREMTPKSVAARLRVCHPKFMNLTDEQFEALYYRTTLAEFHEQKAAFLEKEAADQAEAEAEEKALKAEAEAKQQALKAADEAKEQEGAAHGAAA